MSNVYKQQGIKYKYQPCMMEKTQKNHTKIKAPKKKLIKTTVATKRSKKKHGTKHIFHYNTYLRTYL